MSLLPRHHDDFRKKEYWDKFFEKRGDKAFEWYGTYRDLKPIFRKTNVVPSEEMLMVGCGNSSLSEELYHDGHHRITNIDFSEKLIEDMALKHKSLSGMNWQVMDMTSMTFEDKSFDVVMDKGALDALMASDTDEIRLNATRMFEQVNRVLRNGGKYICVTMAQDFILKHLVQNFLCEQWSVNVLEITQTKRNNETTGGIRPFFFCFTKPESNARASTVQFMDLRCLKEGSCERIRWLIEQVEACQWYGMHQKELKKIQVGRRQTVELFDSEQSTNSKYTLHILDMSIHPTLQPCAVFIVPLGREQEWLFSTNEGREQLATGAKFQRLIVAQMGHYHTFDSLDVVQNELSPKILELAPSSNSTHTSKIPFLTVAEGIGKREVIAHCSSDISGDILIEEVPKEACADVFFRRLLFKTNLNVIQSEVEWIRPSNANTCTSEHTAVPDMSALSRDEKKKLRKKLKKNEKRRLEALVSSGKLNADYLAFPYHRGMFSGLTKLLLDGEQNMDSSISSPKRLKTLVIGLGGGSLVTFLSNHFPRMDIEAVELDESIVEIAKKYFGFSESPSTRVVVQDGIKFVADKAQQTLEPSQLYDCVVVDVDAKDVSVGMSCPPEAFVEKSFLRNMAAILSPSAVCAFNISCRSGELYKKTVQKIAEALSGSDTAPHNEDPSDVPVRILELLPSDEDVNKVLFVQKVKSNGLGSHMPVPEKQLFSRFEAFDAEQREELQDLVQSMHELQLRKTNVHSS